LPPEPTPKDTNNPNTPGRDLSLLLDWAERLTLTALYLWLVWRVLSPLLEDPLKRELTALFLLASEGLALFFLLIRRKTRAISRNPWEWLLALAATASSLLVSPGRGVPVLPELVAAVISVMGILVQLHAKISLGRSIGAVPANRGLKTSGPYQIVRHPMYAGYFLSHLAFFLMNLSLWNALIYGVAYALQIPRLLAEERFLSSDPEYRAYMSRVRYRLFPGLF
jgi:protein-S-isoprenylcysteine O-methyltransferase Ste14